MTDSFGREVVFRDMLGSDLEYLDSVLGTEKDTVSSSEVMQVLEYLCVSPTEFRAGKLTPRVVRELYHKVSENILCNYISKDIWLRQCYSIQNGSFQGLEAMERVPMSKFTAMCLIHKEAMDQIKKPTSNDDFTSPNPV